MRSHIKLGRIFGIKIGLHYSWLLIAFLIVFSLASNYHLNHPQWSNSLVVGLAVATALCFFSSLLLHELSHSLMAKAHGLPVHEITLFALGGVSQLGKEATRAKDEFSIAVVGPLTSLFIGFLCLGAVALAGGSGATSGPFTTMLSWLGYINMGLAIFNLVPGYPMDGGRILRAILWWKTGDLDRATRTAARVGQGVAIVFILGGFFGYLRGGGLGSLWIAFIGWFLLQAARESYAETVLRKILASVRVSDLMLHDLPTVDGHNTIQNFVEDTLLHTGGHSFLVTENGHPVGLLTPREIKPVDRLQWPLTPIDAVMRPLIDAHTVPPEMPMLRALEVMGQEDLTQLPVVSNGHFEGVLARNRIADYLQTVMDLRGVGDSSR
jgi:Zn-dependent protease/predicted transcriptional regulator